MGELNARVRKLKELGWEEVYEKDNERLDMRHPPFDILIKNKEYRFEWAIKQINTHYGKDARILNIGSSSGVFEHFLVKDGFTNVVGLDVDNKTIKRCKDRVKDCKFIKAFVESIPSNDEQKDVVVCSQVLEHLIDPKVAIKEMLRVLKTDGLLLITVPIGDHLNNELHKHKFDLYQITHLFEEFGQNFKVMEIHKWDVRKVQTDPNVFAVVYRK